MRSHVPTMGALIFLSIVLMGTGCYHGSAVNVARGDIERDRGWKVVDGVPLIRQKAERDCGAVALSMVMRRWGVPTVPDEILTAYPPAPGHGIPAGALRDFARGKRLGAYLIQGELSDLRREIESSRPVLIGLVQQTGSRAYPHYAVVIGVNDQKRRVLMLDPARDLREDGFDGFTQEWQGAGKLALVVGHNN